MFETFNREAVSGINCINPFAPFLEMAPGLNPDSARMIALIKAKSTWYFFENSEISWSY
jgi:hypothetical protein